MNEIAPISLPYGARQESILLIVPSEVKLLLFKLNAILVVTAVYKSIAILAILSSILLLSKSLMILFIVFSSNLAANVLLLPSSSSM